MSTETKHTPLPWEISPASAAVIIDDPDSKSPLLIARTDQEQLICEIVAAVAPFSDPELAKRNLLSRMAACEIQPETPEALAWLRMMKRQTAAHLAGCVPV